VRSDELLHGKSPRVMCASLRKLPTAARIDFLITVGGRLAPGPVSVKGYLIPGQARPGFVRQAVGEVVPPSVESISALRCK
jgi:hypothetical protein